MRIVAGRVSAKNVAVLLVWTLAVLLFTGYVLMRFDARSGFLGMIHFGSHFKEKAIPQLRGVNPPAVSRYGYDGQFYAQVALDPTLRTPEFREALDVPAYRARRIMMPAMAHVLGAGKPFWVLQIFALLNLAAWFALLFGFWRFLRPTTVREHCCLLAAALTAGAFYSIQRSLLDLPAATLAFYGATLAMGAGPALLAAILTKETHALSLVALPSLSGDGKKRALRNVVRVALILAPVLLWFVYVDRMLGRRLASAADFSWPFQGYLFAIENGFAKFGEKPTLRAFFAAVAPVSLGVQLGWLVVTRRIDCRYWRMGCMFGLASIFLSKEPFVEPTSFCRDTIPLTLAFNLGLMRDRSWKFWIWFAAGNVGLAWGAIHCVQEWFR